jgi:hypothetical protein
MGQNLKAGQWWRDVVNGDLLKIVEFSDYTPESPFAPSEFKSVSMRALAAGGFETVREPWGEGERPEPAPPAAVCPVQYVRCACFVNGGPVSGVGDVKWTAGQGPWTYFGVQEMKASRFTEIYLGLESVGLDPQPRFVKVGWFQSLWYRWTLR